MTEADLNELERLDREASSGPWFVRRLDDEMCMGAIVISRSPITGDDISMRAGNWPSGDIVAGCLIQSPPYAVTSDDKFEENAELIAAIRNVLPELIQLARREMKRCS